jgi:hypothetical protein
MNEPYDPLEAELAALQPREPSPELRQRIESELSPRWLRVAQRTAAGRAVGIALATALAACALVSFVLRPGPRPTIAQPRDEIPRPNLTAAFDDSLPTIWTYQRALSRSASDLEALLDKHAALSSSSARSTPTAVFIRSDRQLLLEGEL